MTTQELNAKTVLELRKIAKENGVKLGAGVSKSDIVEKIAAALESKAPTAQETAAPAPKPAEPAPAAAPVAAPAAAPAAAPQEDKPAQPQFRQAWQNPSSTPRYNTKPAYQAPAYPQRQGSGWQQRQGGRAPASSNDLPHMQTVRPQRYTPRFGPNAGEPITSTPQQEEYQPVRPAYLQERPAYTPPERPAYQAERPAYQAERPAYQQDRSFHDNSRSYDHSCESAPHAPQYDAPYQRAPYQQRRENAYQQPDSLTSAELISPVDCADGSGVLELHPDGYGFLRARTCIPSSHDIYIAQAQVRRFGLRSGDLVTGKIRPQREGDKYAAMLYITDVNGASPDELSTRPMFDELTPIYPTRRIDLDHHNGPVCNDMRIVDLIAPLGFGQRALVYCPPECSKTELLQHFAQVISRNHPETSTFALLLDERPEDVTLFRDAVPGCTVVASNFGQQPETHLRVADLLLERAMRLVEAGQDVVLLVDSLTRYAKVCPAAAAQQRGCMPGMVVPSSLYKAKRLFSSARCMREGGSLTVIAAMSIETGNRVDDTIIEEFADTANMELTLDQNMARAGVHPAINLLKSKTHRVEQLLTDTQLKGLQHVRRILGTTPSVQAVPQLLSMMDKTNSNDEFYERISGWAEQMEKSR